MKDEKRNKRCSGKDQERTFRSKKREKKGNNERKKRKENDIRKM